MTNKSKVSVPRELLERALSYAWFPSGEVGVFDMRLIDREQLSAILAAPAEDVRAVVDEPVGYRVRFLKEPDHWMVGWKPLPADLNPHCEYQLLYRRPQRQMVLPERREPSPESPYLSDADIEWNACLDRIAELNK